MKKYFLEYALALALIAICTAGSLAGLPLRVAFAGIPDTLFLVAVSVVALCTRLRVSLVTLALSALVLGGWIFPLYSGGTSTAVAVRTVAFTVAALIICLLAQRARVAARNKADEVIAERKTQDASRESEALRELREAHQQLSMILGSISESFLVLDRQWRFVYANQRVLKQTGKSWPELAGKNIWETFPEAAATAFKAGYEKVMLERVPHTFDVSYPRQDGALSHYQVHAYPASDGLSALVSDVSTKKKDENQLAEGRRLQRMILDTARVGTWILDLETDEVLDLGNTASLLGLQRIASRQDILPLLHPEDRAMVDRAMEDAAITGHFDAEYRVNLPDGSIARMHGIGSILSDDPVHPRMAGVLMDVTDRGRAEEARMRLAAIVDSSDDAIISKDLNGLVTSWNAAAVRLFGYSAEEMLGRSILTIIPPELQSEEPEILAALRRGEKIDHYETERLRKNGERISVSLCISPMRDTRGNVIGASKIARNISERARMQAAMIESEKLAATGRMAAAIAHEINNPLEAVMNLAFLLSTDPSLSDSAKRYAGMLLDEIGRASHVAKQSLGFFRDNSKPAMFDVSELLDSVLRLNRPMLERKGIEVVRDYRSGDLIFGSSPELRQVFANLIRNAIEALDERGRIQVRVRTDPSGVQRVLIADNGHGIPPETRRRLFEPFVTSKGAAGNGLGLWVSSGIIRKHAGRIRVKTSTTRGCSGTVFAIFLPVEGGSPVVKAAETVLPQEVVH